MGDLIFYGKTTQEIQDFVPDVYFKKLGLEGQLSPSRTNGLYALTNTMIGVVKPKSNKQ